MSLPFIIVISTSQGLEYKSSYVIKGTFNIIQSLKFQALATLSI